MTESNIVEAIKANRNLLRRKVVYMKKRKLAEKGMAGLLVMILVLLCCACSGSPSDTDSKSSDISENIVSAGDVDGDSVSDVGFEESTAEAESGNEATSKNDQTDKTPTASKNNATAPSGNTNGNTGATSGKITVMVTDKSATPTSEGTTENNRWTKWIQSQVKSLGIEVSYVMVGIQDQDDVLMAKMASGNAPDIVSTYTLSLFQKYAQQGAIKDMTDSLSKYGQKIVALNKGSDTLEYGKINGRQYAIPQRRYVKDWMVAYIRKDWVDQVGMSLPTNRDELVKVLTAFRDQKPAGNATIPWGNNVRGYEYKTHILDMYSFCENTLEERYCIPMYYRNGYKLDAQWCNMLYKQKIIDPNFQTTDHVAEIKAGNVGFFISGWWDPVSEDAGGWMSTLKKKIPSAELVAVDCFKDKNGKYFKESYASYNYFNMIPSTCKNPIVAMKYLNFLADEDVILKLNYGDAGTHYKMIGTTPITLDTAKTAAEVSYVGPALSLIAPYDDNKVDKTLSTAPLKWGKMQIQARKVASNDAVEEVTFKESVIQSEVKYNQQILSTVNTYWNKLLTASDFEATWTQYVNALKRNGIEEIVKERTAYYNKYVKNK